MSPTPRETAAVQKLAQAILEFIAAIEDGWIARVETAAKSAVAARPVAQPPPRPEAKAPPVKKESLQSPATLLLTVSEAATLLSVSNRTVWRLASRGGPLPKLRIGRAVRIPVAGIHALIEQRQENPNRRW